MTIILVAVCKLLQKTFYCIYDFFYYKTCLEHFSKMLMKRLDNIFENMYFYVKKNQINKKQLSIIVTDLELLIMLT